MSVEPNRLCVPKARNQDALELFFRLGTYFYIFQLSTVKSHDIKNGIEESSSKMMTILPPKTSCRFVFITPPDYEVDVKPTTEVEQFFGGVTLYPAPLDIDQQRMRFNPPEVHLPEPEWGKWLLFKERSIVKKRMQLMSDAVRGRSNVALNWMSAGGVGKGGRRG